MARQFHLRTRSRPRGTYYLRPYPLAPHRQTYLGARRTLLPHLTACFEPLATDAHALSQRQVARIAPEEFWKFSLALFAAQRDYYDIPVSTLTPTQIREKLAALVAETLGEDKAAPFKDLVTLKSTPNGGVDVTDDLKYTSEFCRLEYRRNRRARLDCFGRA